MEDVEGKDGNTKDTTISTATKKNSVVLSARLMTVPWYRTITRDEWRALAAEN
jgi:hypothetical protein